MSSERGKKHMSNQTFVFAESRAAVDDKRRNDRPTDKRNCDVGQIARDIDMKKAGIDEPEPADVECHAQRQPELTESRNGDSAAERHLTQASTKFAKPPSLDEYRLVPFLLRSARYISAEVPLDARLNWIKLRHWRQLPGQTCYRYPAKLKAPKSHAITHHVVLS